MFYGQNEVVGELICAGKIDEEYMYPFVDTDDEVFEWWLVSPYLARELKEQGEVIIDALGSIGGDVPPADRLSTWTA